MAENITAYPLCWPGSWKRTAPGDRKRATFNAKNRDPSRPYVLTNRLNVSQATERVLYELARLNVERGDMIISTNVKVRLDGLPYSSQAEPADPGAAVYWRPRGTQQTKCMAVDRYDRVADNLAAIAATLEAMRAIERHGGAEILERAFLGFQALPPPITAARPWWEVLGFEDGRAVSLEDAERAFRELCKTHHPDAGGNAEDFTALADAIRAARGVL